MQRQQLRCVEVVFGTVRTSGRAWLTVLHTVPRPAVEPDCLQPSSMAAKTELNLSNTQQDSDVSHVQELAAAWQPVSFTVSAVQLISREGYHEPFRIRWEVPLGGTADPAEVNIPYVATAGDTVAPPGSLVSVLLICLRLGPPAVGHACHSQIDDAVTRPTITQVPCFRRRQLGMALEHRKLTISPLVPTSAPRS